MVSEELIKSHITRNPDVLGGKPIIRGTRVAVSLIVAFSENGLTPEEIVADYPDLTAEDVEAALAFAALEDARTELRAR
jgi:uncharacterized protein (DUF433 family)